MDLNIQIENGKFFTRLFEKEMNLFLFLSPMTAHPPGMLKSLVIGMVICIVHLTTYCTEAQSDVQNFFDHLCARGYPRKGLAQLFRMVIQRAFYKSITLLTGPEPPPKCTVILHVPYHSKNPALTVLQSLFHRYMVGMPPYYYTTKS